MEALINNHQSQSLDLLLIQEPSITIYYIYINYSAQQLYQPIYLNTNESIRFRSLLYINKRILTSSHRQIYYNYPDLVAIKVQTAEIQFLIFSVYIPPLNIYQATNTTPTKSALKEIQNTIKQYTRESNKPTKLILVGDFNQHHPAQSHCSISHIFTV